MADVTNEGKAFDPTNRGAISINKNDDNFLFFDGDNYRMIVGFDSDANPVVKISEEGFSVLNAADDELIFNSDRNVFKIAQTGTVEFSKGANSAGASTQVAHGLNFTPIVIAYFLSGSLYYPFGDLGVAATGANSGKVTRATSLSVDANNVYFGVQTPDWSGNGNYTAAETYTVKYYLLEETAN